MRGAQYRIARQGPAMTQLPNYLLIDLETDDNVATNLLLCHRVRVVVHQAVGQDPKCELPPVVGEPAKIVLPVSISSFPLLGGPWRP